MRSQSINWLYVATAITIGYCISVGAILGPPQIWCFIQRTSELNAVGDFVAGIFAPLAFIWLVAAVLTQRQELTESREQFKDSQDVIKAQLDNADAQARLISDQQARAQQETVRNYRLRLFPARFEIYAEFEGEVTKLLGPKPEDTNRHFLIKLAHRSEFVFSKEIADYIRKVAESVESLQKAADDLLGRFELHGDVWVAKEHSEADRISVQQRYDQEKLSLLLMTSESSRRGIFADYLTVTDVHQSYVVDEDEADLMDEDQQEFNRNA